MIPKVLGIDLGSSGLKLFYRREQGSQTFRQEYEEAGPNGWWKALCRALQQCDLSQVEGLGLSSQVGTYIVNHTDCILWSEPAGKEELAEVMAQVTQDTFLKEVSMLHPNLFSYPLPRLCYLKKHYPRIESVCMPKDYLMEKLIGTKVSDPYSWRGLANLKTGNYSAYLLKTFQIEERSLPKLQWPQAIAGYVTGDAAKVTGLKEGIPVYTGCNDFFAGLLGMGMLEEEILFDVTGTSEHLGKLTKQAPDPELAIIQGAYFKEQVMYGVTASSGASLTFGQELYDFNDPSLEDCIYEEPPIFLPYVNGERAPIWDPKATGVFFGITAKTTRKHMAYAVMEGVTFSLYHIYEAMKAPKANAIRTAGGAAQNPVLCSLKASMFGMPVHSMEESACSALGAWMLAAVGSGGYKSLQQAAEDNCRVSSSSFPKEEKTKLLRKRFAMYKELYPALRSSFQKWN